MTSENLQRTTYRDPTTPGNPVRAGSPTRAENALDMDQYYRPLERIHGTSLHGWGVAAGLNVSATLNSPNTTITVLPGVALDSNGQHISLAVGGNAEIGPTADAPGANPTLAPVTATGVGLPIPSTGSGDQYLTIQFWETFDTDGFQNLGTFRYFHTPWLRLLDVAGFVNDGTRLVLAKVSLGTGATAGQVTALVPDVRQATDLPVGSIHLLKSATTSPAANAETVQAAEAGVIRAYGGGGIDVTVPNPTDEVHLERDDGGNFAKVSLGAEKIVARQGNGTTESVVIDSEAGSITASGDVTANGSINASSITASSATVNGPISATSVTASANIDASTVNANTSIRQNRLYLSGGADGSSFTYNAHRNDANTDWVFPDPTHASVTLEMDDTNGTPRFQVWSNTTGNSTGWVERFAIDGNTGLVTARNGISSSTSTFGAPGVIGVGGPGTIFFPGRPGISAGPGVLGIGGSILGQFITGLAGDFHGNVNVTGNLSKGGGGFKIDHPLDPANKYLSHSFVESSEMKNIYDGVAVLDDNGEAVVELPVWVEALNTEFRYQLTCIGGYAPVYIAEKVHDNRFKIAGGEPEMEVSWLMTGIRRDAWANAHRLSVEEDKPAEEQGYYLHPELHGASREKQVLLVHYPETAALLTLPEQGTEEES